MSAGGKKKIIDLKAKREGSISRQCSLYFQHNALRTKTWASLCFQGPASPLLAPRAPESLVLEYRRSPAVMAVTIQLQGRGLEKAVGLSPLHPVLAE